MKKSVRDCCIVVVVAILVGILTFLLFNSGLLLITPLNVFFFLIVDAIGIIVLVTLMKMQCKDCGRHMKDAYCCCGHLVAIGAVGSILLSLLLSLATIEIPVLFSGGMALLFFFITMMLGGIVCFLYSLNGCHGQCIPENECNKVVHENVVRNEYNRNDYPHQNNRR